MRWRSTFEEEAEVPEGEGGAGEGGMRGRFMEPRS